MDLVRVADLRSWRALRSASTSRLVVPAFKRSVLGGRTFQVSGSRVLNQLPKDVAKAPTLPIFRHRLKTYLFQKSYPDTEMEPGLWVTGHRVSDFARVRSGRVTGQCVRPGV